MPSTRHRQLVLLQAILGKIGPFARGRKVGNIAGERIEQMLVPSRTCPPEAAGGSAWSGI